jgi:hypothetical protein
MDASAAGMAALILWRYLDRIFDIYAGWAREFDSEVYTPVWKPEGCPTRDWVSDRSGRVRLTPVARRPPANR